MRNPYGRLRSDGVPIGSHIGRIEVPRPTLLGGGGVIDLSDSTLCAMLDQLNPAVNNYQFAGALESSSDRTGVDVFYAQSMIYSIPDGGVLGADILGFSALLSDINLIGVATAFTGPSPSMTCQIRFYSDEIDPETIVWNDRAGLTLLGSAFTFNNDIITSFTQAAVTTEIDLTVGGDTGAYLGVFAEPSSGLNAQTFRSVEIVLDAPGVIDPTTGESSFAAAITAPKFWLGGDA